MILHVGHRENDMFKIVAKRFKQYRAYNQLFVLVLAIPVGFFLPMLFHMVIGHRFLPLPEPQWGSTEEAIFVRNLIVANGFLSILVCLVGTVIFLIRDKKSSFWAAVLCAGLMLGATGFMIVTCSNGWSCFMR
jgi:hypothetical protein